MDLESNFLVDTDRMGSLQGDMDSEHSSNVEELVNVEEHPGSHTADDKHSALTRLVFLFIRAFSLHRVLGSRLDWSDFCQNPFSPMSFLC